MNGCNENAIEFMTNGTKATLTFSQGRYKSVIRKLAEKHPDDCQIVADNEDGRAETDVIKEFVEYARMQGSTHADHYYSNYTRLAYKSVGITDKTTAAGSQLDDLSLVEHLIAHTLRTGMAAGRNYKDIYQDCKNRLEAMRYLQCTA